MQNLNKLLVLASLCIFLISRSVEAQRVAPGVPVQQYQQPVHQQGHHQQHHQQQQQVHYQQHQPPNVNPNAYQQDPNYPHQVPVQHHQAAPQHYESPQQVPVQHVQQVPNAQAGVYQQPSHHQAGGHHGHHGQPQQVLNAANMQHEREHIAEHMEVPIDTSKMTDQELQFHYFKMHDSDHNNKLDGCELIKSLIHWHEKSGEKEKRASDIYSDEELSDTIDQVLKYMDVNKDGYVSYPEYRANEDAKIANADK